LWLYGVARRVIANSRRSVRRRDRLVERLRAAVATAVNEIDLGYDSLSVEVASALRSLSDVEREILLLTATEGLAPSEIASVLAMNPQTVRTHLHRARMKVRSLLVSKGIVGESDDGMKQIDIVGHVEAGRNTPCLDETKGQRS
jgi:RNA polymerase sigma factor (sigma-70 family)